MIPLSAPLSLLTTLMQPQPRIPAQAPPQGEHPVHLVAPLPRLRLPQPASNAIAAVANPNRTAAGALSGRVLTLTMDVVTARSKPEGDDDPEVPVLAFAESGKPPSVPGPLLRVRVGTEVRPMLTNRTDSALVIGGLHPGANPTLPQGDSVRFRVVNSTSMNHPMHLHGFYYRIEERAGRRLPTNRQALTNTDLVNAFTTEVFSFVPSTPGNWVFHGPFAFQVDEIVSLIGSPRDSEAMQSATTAHVMPTTAGGAAPTAQGGHSMRGLVIAMQVTPKPGYAPPSMANARTIRLHVQDQPNCLVGGVDAIGSVEQRGDTTPDPHTVSIPGPVLELVRGEPVRIVVRTNDTVTARWRAIARDGADLPRALATTRTANVRMGPGETADFRFAPPTPGRWQLDVASDGAGWQD